MAAHAQATSAGIASAARECAPRKRTPHPWRSEIRVRNGAFFVR
jgi:hypothetical protein